jgi:hypothetical protein
MQDSRLVQLRPGVPVHRRLGLAERLGVDGTQVIHLALHELAVKLLPQYETDDAPLTAAQVWQIKKRAPQGRKQSVRSSLFEAAPA